MTYARARLWLGISGVGLQVVAASVALWFDLPHRLLRGFSSVAAIALTCGCYVLLSIPSDVLGGFVLPQLHGRSKVSGGAFLSGWVRGVVSQVLVTSLCALALLTAASTGGVWAGGACFALLMVGLVIVQSAMARLVGGMVPVADRKAPADEQGGFRLPAEVYAATDGGFTGGITGLPGWERLILPASWVNELPEVLAVERIRREGVLATGARTRGLAVALGWNLAGFLAASHLPGSSPADAPGLLRCALWFTLWSFVGLLLLPSLNRPGVLEADRFALEHGASPEMLAGAISSLDRLQDDEPARGRWVERIFHPIPSVESRVIAAAGSHARRGAWQGARMALYLSWACFGFLSRAVHCNAGRPELWVLLPSD